MKNRVLSLIPVIAAASLSFMALLDLAAWSYSRQERARDQRARRSYWSSRVREQQEAQSHVVRLSGPSYQFVGRDGQTYVWVDDPGPYQIPALPSSR